MITLLKNPSSYQPDLFSGNDCKPYLRKSKKGTFAKILELKEISIHTRENNPSSEAILKANLPRISKQCQKTLDLLKSGIRITVYDAITKYGISSLPRRILDLRQAGFEIKDRLIDGRYKEWWVE